MANNDVTFKINSVGQGVRSEISAGKNKFIIDEDADMGGSDTGANPLQSLLGTLAGCEEVIATVVAKEKKFDFNGINFDVEGTLDIRGLMGNSSVQPYFHTVKIRAKVKTNENDDRIKELKEAVDSRCPVYTTLKAAGINIDSLWSRA